MNESVYPVGDLSTFSLYKLLTLFSCTMQELPCQAKYPLRKLYSDTVIQRQGG